MERLREEAIEFGVKGLNEMDLFIESLVGAAFCIVLD